MNEVVISFVHSLIGLRKLEIDLFLFYIYQAKEWMGQFYEQS